MCIKSTATTTILILHEFCTGRILAVVSCSINTDHLSILNNTISNVLSNFMLAQREGPDASSTGDKRASDNSMLSGGTVPYLRRANNFESWRAEKHKVW